MNATYIIPCAGQTYTNFNGNTYLCLQSGIGSQPGREMTAKFERQPDGWTIEAHGVAQFEDGSIEWDYSTGGHWPGGWPKNWSR